VSITQSNYRAGYLEWVAPVDVELYSGWRDDGASWAWNGPYAFSAQPCCDASTVVWLTGGRGRRVAKAECDKHDKREAVAPSRQDGGLVVAH